MEIQFKNIKFLNRRNFMILGAVLLIGILCLSIVLEKEVIIKDRDKTFKVKASFGHVEDVIRKGHIQLGSHDQVSVPKDRKIEDGMVVTIQRAHPIHLVVNGENKEVRTANKKVKDILKEYKISLGSKDYVTPKIDKDVESNDTVKVVRIEEKTLMAKEAIPYENVIHESDQLDQGKVQVVQKGINGKKESKYKIVYEDGLQKSKELLEETVLVKPIDQIIKKGTATVVATSRGDMRVKKVLSMTATSYDISYESCGKHPWDKGYGITRSGTHVRPGVAAVDPRVIPLGTKLYVKSLDGSKDYGFASAEDIGGAIKGNKIDLYFEKPSDVKKFGKRKVEVYILK